MAAGAPAAERPIPSKSALHVSHPPGSGRFVLLQHSNFVLTFAQNYQGEICRSIAILLCYRRLKDSKLYIFVLSLAEVSILTHIPLHDHD